MSANLEESPRGAVWGRRWRRTIVGNEEKIKACAAAESNFETEFPAMVARCMPGESGVLTAPRDTLHRSRATLVGPTTCRKPCICMLAHFAVRWAYAIPQSDASFAPLCSAAMTIGDLVDLAN